MDNLILHIVATLQMIIEYRCAVPWICSADVATNVTSCPSFYHINTIFYSSHVHPGVMLPNWGQTSLLIFVFILHLQSRTEQTNK
jgi:hypothetical protein